jgi:hypothetical protein
MTPQNSFLNQNKSALLTCFEHTFLLCQKIDSDDLLNYYVTRVRACLKSFRSPQPPLKKGKRYSSPFLRGIEGDQVEFLLNFKLYQTRS